MKGYIYINTVDRCILVIQTLNLIPKQTPVFNSKYATYFSSSPIKNLKIIKQSDLTTLVDECRDINMRIYRVGDIINSNVLLIYKSWKAICNIVEKGRNIDGKYKIYDEDGKVIGVDYIQNQKA
jgi:hypothetical protein